MEFSPPADYAPNLTLRFYASLVGGENSIRRRLRFCMVGYNMTLQKRISPMLTPTLLTVLRSYVLTLLQVPFGMVGRSHQRPTLHKRKTALHTFFLIHRESIRVDKFCNCEVHWRRLKILADGQDITTMSP